MIELLEKDLKPIARLENATNVSIEEVLNQPGQSFVSFELPYNDPKFKDCHSFRFIQPYDAKGVERFDPYRIMPRTFEHNPTGIASIECEHCITTLADDLLFGYHEIGGTGYYTKQALEYVLDQQTVKNWVLGICEFNHQFQYSWENENLLQALYSIPNCFADDYQFSFDTSAYPWTVNLIKLDKGGKPKSRFRYDYNVNSVRKEEDTKELCNKMYCLGYGEGINQLTIASVNNGLPYIENKASQAKYGVITRAWVDRRFEYADALLARGQALLESYSKPRLSYSLDALDLFPITNNPMDKPRIGDITIIEDDELEEKSYQSIIVSVKRSDVFGPTPTTQIEVENTKADLAGTLTEQADKLHVEQSYAQGATNIWSLPFADNADQTHPIIIELFIPEYTKIVNRVNLRWRAEAFRADVRGIASAQQTSQTTSNYPGQSQTSESGGGTSTSTSSGGGTNTSTGQSSKSSSEVAWGNWGTMATMFTSYEHTSSGTSHRHDLSDYFTAFMNAIMNRHYHNIEHTHNFYVQSHTHDFSVRAHSHRVTIPGHAHTVLIPAHTHGNEYGIFEGPKATAALISIGKNTFTVPQDTDFDITDYLEKDSGGLIKRGVSHIIKITPDGLTRLAGTLTPQVFIQSRGGGNY